MPIKSNIKLLYFFTHASIPEGYTRDTAFDGKYIRACASGTTIGGTAGGANDHYHLASALHTHTIVCAEAREIVYVERERDFKSLNPSHTHDDSTSGQETGTIVFSTELNNPIYYTTIVINSSNNTNLIPLNAGGFCESSTLSGMTEKTEARGKMIRGAATGANAGTAGGVSSHSHTSAEHIHDYFESSRSEKRPITTDEGERAAPARHTHILNPGLAQALTQSATSIPTNKSLAVMYNTNPFPIEVMDDFIAMWTGNKSEIPRGWSEYTAQQSFFQMTWVGTGSVVVEGGATNHTHSGETHYHSIEQIDEYSPVYGTDRGDIEESEYRHKHRWSDQGATVNTSGTYDTFYPPYIEVFFIKYKTPPTNNRFFQRWHRQIIHPSTEVIPKIHLKCNDNAANTIVANDGSLGGSATASANTSLLTTTGKINAGFSFNRLYSLDMSSFVSGIRNDTKGCFNFWIYTFYDGRDLSPVEDRIVYLSDGTYDNFFQISYYPSMRWLIIGLAVGGAYQFYTNRYLTYNAWHHISLNQDGNSVTLKINNVAQTFDQFNFPSKWIGDLQGTITYTPDNPLYYQDDFRYYGQNLSSANEDFLWNSGNGTEAGLPGTPAWTEYL